MRIEGYTTDEILALPDAELEAFVFTDTSLVLQAGSAQVLGQFRRDQNRLVVELAHIEGGGEGVLPALWILAARYARRRKLPEVEWIVHAVHCAQPNLQLRRVLERRGFTVDDLPGIGPAYHLTQQVTSEMVQDNSDGSARNGDVHN